MRGERGLQGERGEQGEQGAPGENGKNGEPGIKGERGERGPVGMLPIVRAWEDHVYYVGDVVHYAGSTYQAVRDTGRAPSFDDWALLAMRGMDGVNGTNGRSLHHCGTYSVDAEYEALDVVILNGASFVAKQNKPGECPGDGWQLMAQKGERGNKGERGVKGDRGERGLTGATVASINCDLEGLLTMTMSDGSKVVCDLYPVLSRIGVA